MKKQRVIGVGILMLLAALLLPCGTTAFAKTIAKGECGKNLSWKLDDKGKLTISGSGKMDKFPGESSAGVGFSPWNAYGSKIKKLELKKGITSISNGAFNSCKITEVTIPSTVKEIDRNAFFKCSKLKTVTIPAATKVIGEGSTSLLFGATPPAFNECTALKNVNIDKKNKYFCSVDGVVYNKKKTALVYYPSGKTATSFTIPSSVTKICGSAFADAQKLTSVTIGAKVNMIERTAFARCKKLKNVTIKTKKLKAANMGDEIFMDISSSVTFKVPSAKMSAYKTLLKARCNSKKIKYKKL